MWMDALFQEALIREQMAEAHRQAAERQLLRRARPPRPPRRPWGVRRRLLHALAWPRLKRLIERTASS